MQTEILTSVKEVNNVYSSEGFILLGVFGSQARGDVTGVSDIDVLYTITDIAIKKYPGWEFYTLYEKVKNALESKTGKKVDLADIEALSDTGKAFILKEVDYV